MYYDVALSDKSREGILDNLSASFEVGKVAGSVFEALMVHIHPRVSAFATLVVAIDALEKKDFGIFPDYESVWLPTTVLDNEWLVRYRTDAMETVYESLMPVCVSELTRSCLQKALQLHGLQILFLCNGSFLLGEEKDIRAFGGSLEHIRRERRCSEADVSWPIRRVGGFDRMTDSTDCLCPKGAEKRLFQRIEGVLEDVMSASASAH